MVSTMSEQHNLMTVAELAGILRVSPPRAYALIEEAGIPYVRLTERRIRIPKDAFEAWISERTYRAERHKKEVLSR